MKHRRRIRSGAWRVAWIGLPILAIGPRPSCAQSVLAIEVRDSNGQFDLWLPFDRRRDDEHTNSARAQVLVSGAPFWGRLLTATLAPCGTSSRPTDVADARRPCTTSEWAIGQDIYNPRSAFTFRLPFQGDRPYAAWLYLSGTGRRTAAVFSDALSLDLGVVGPPALGESIQNGVHRLFGFGAALGWAHQVPFQPGIRLGVRRDQQILDWELGDVRVLTVTPFVGASVGNILTGAAAGIQGRVGYGVTPPWSAALAGHSSRLEVYALSGIREDWVLHELVLDAGTVHPSLTVSKEPLVTQYEFGGGLRLWAVEAQYRALTILREYTTGPPRREYGEFTVGVRTRW